MVQSLRPHPHATIQRETRGARMGMRMRRGCDDRARAEKEGMAWGVCVGVWVVVGGFLYLFFAPSLKINPTPKPTA